METESKTFSRSLSERESERSQGCRYRHPNPPDIGDGEVPVIGVIQPQPPAIPIAQRNEDGDHEMEKIHKCDQVVARCICAHTSSETRSVHLHYLHY